MRALVQLPSGGTQGASSFGTPIDLIKPASSSVKMKYDIAKL
jgi:hypothetical protein